MKKKRKQKCQTKYQPTEGLKLSDFLKILETDDRNNIKSSGISGEKRMIRQIYKSFINNQNFKDIENIENKNKKLETLKSIITSAIGVTKGISDKDRDIYNKIRSCSNNLFKYKDTLTEATEHISKKLNEVKTRSKNGEEKTYDNFRVKGDIEKVILKFIKTSSLSEAINSDETESFSRDDVEDIYDELNEFLENVKSKINEISKYNPLVKIRNSIISILDKENGANKFKEFKKVKYDNNVEKLIKEIDEINKDWENRGVKDICTKFKTLNTEHKFTKNLRKIAKKGGKVLWVGALIAGMVGLKTKML